jgi:hypothetical protein
VQGLDFMAHPLYIHTRYIYNKNKSEIYVDLHIQNYFYIHFYTIFYLSSHLIFISFGPRKSVHLKKIGGENVEYILLAEDRDQ